MGDTNIYIDGFGVSGYRSFGETLQYIGPFSKINVIIGQNNVGKSNIINFLTDHYRDCIESMKHGATKVKLAPIDQHVGRKGNLFTFVVGLKIDGDRYKSVLNIYSGKIDRRLKEDIKSILCSKTLSHTPGVAWFTYQASWHESLGKLNISPSLLDSLETEEVLSPDEWRDAFQQLTSHADAALQSCISGFIRDLSPIQLPPPQIRRIPAKRQIREEESTSSDDYSGVGLIHALAKLQNPSYDQQASKRQFDQINTFLQTVVGNPSATLEIPYDRNTIIVHMDDRALPLSSLGMGIHEVIILAAAATVLTDQVICIEEPEIHLHPTLQRKLLQYFAEKTTNQYFIATHSAHILDTPNAAVFHVRHEDGQSIVEQVLTPHAKGTICDTLGYKPSDFAQSNSIIWVEGPSDRIYLNYWIRKKDENLVEGLHYSIMFYGGRLLSHLSASDEEVEEVSDFIELRRLNRHSAILIDSDKAKATDSINATKQRIVGEFTHDPGYAWVTQGREIENYIPFDLLGRAIQHVHPHAVPVVAGGQYKDCLYVQTAEGKRMKTVDKVKIAQTVVNLKPVMDILDLEERVTQLIHFIYKANHMPVL